ncbi:MAG TPA: hypothetical protein VNA31_02545 [bacterium]|nr:hypothetical protein [bacterium]
MTNLRLLAILILTLSLLVGVSGAQTSCGTARWDGKTLTDAASGSVDFTVRDATAFIRAFGQPLGQFSRPAGAGR